LKSLLGHTWYELMMIANCQLVPVRQDVVNTLINKLNQHT
jgi:hypothetical protein